MRNQFKDGVLLDGRFETLSALNHGSFGLVFMARDHLTGENVAVKCLTKTSDNNACPSAFSIDERSEELSIHRRLSSHPNIVNLIHTFDSEHHFYLVLELCPNGDLYEAIRLGRGPLETEHVRDFMLQLISAVDFMHSNGIYHRDIKPENIFLTQDGSIKLGDFGLATTDEWSYEAAVGSDRYMAPEQYDCGTSGYSPAAADVWAIGICLLNVLFSRNPFAMPTTSDPLFRDFVSDRQSLFDVFPNMSQDTYEILMHCLAIDPANRSLNAVRKALDRVISFTTDDESLDDFCNEDRDVIGATANREPLRTPSVSTANLTQEGAFPWAKALAMTPPQPVRQLSTIHDVDRYSDDMFPESQRTNGEWCSFKPERSSVVSFVDSGLGISLQSNDGTKPRPVKNTVSRPMAIPGSMPARPMPSMASVLGGKMDLVSKSWSDLWDEEEEENIEIENIYQDKLGFKERVWSHETGSGRTTPRAGLTEMKHPASVHNSRNRSPPAAPRSVISEQTGFIFDDLQEQLAGHKEQRKPIVVHVQHSPNAANQAEGRHSPKKRSGFDMTEKWAALGDRRRAQQTAEKQKQKGSPMQSPHSKQQKRPRDLSWKRGTGMGQQGSFQGFDFGVGKGHVQGHQEWSLSKDWRQHVNNSDDDIGDLEWVGGWNDDLHL